MSSVSSSHLSWPINEELKEPGQPDPDFRWRFSTQTQRKLVLDEEAVRERASQRGVACRARRQQNCSSTNNQPVPLHAAGLRQTTEVALTLHYQLSPVPLSSEVSEVQRNCSATTNLCFLAAGLRHTVFWAWNHATHESKFVPFSGSHTCEVPPPSFGQKKNGHFWRIFSSMTYINYICVLCNLGSYLFIL